jgi:hypothetical protein
MKAQTPVEQMRFTGWKLFRTIPTGSVNVRNITEGARREIVATIHDIETDFLFPLLRGRDVRRWLVNPDADAQFLVVQDPETRKGYPESELLEQTPRTFNYLKEHEDMLRKRAAFKRYFQKTGAFYTMFNVGEYTFAPYKVVWAEQGEFGCAVIGTLDEKPLVPDHKVMLVPFESEDEAHYVCAVANSSPFRLAVSAYAIELQQGPHILENVRCHNTMLPIRHIANSYSFRAELTN